MIGMMRSPTSGLHDIVEGHADDHADGEIDEIAAQCELLEIVEHRHPVTSPFPPPRDGRGGPCVPCPAAPGEMS
jgi:hypothetical protein